MLRALKSFRKIFLLQIMTKSNMYLPLRLFVRVLVCTPGAGDLLGGGLPSLVRWKLSELRSTQEERMDEVEQTPSHNISS